MPSLSSTNKHYDLLLEGSHDMELLLHVERFLVNHCQQILPGKILFRMLLIHVLAHNLKEILIIGSFHRVSTRAYYSSFFGSPVEE